MPRGGWRAYRPAMRTLGILATLVTGVAAAGALAAPAPAALPAAPPAAPSPAPSAAPKADVAVTIIAEGTDLSGTVRSSRPAVCAVGRTVVVVKVAGAVGGGDDERFASDTVDRSGGRYVWSTGTTGTEGRFYATLRATADCRPARSGVVRAQRDD